LTTLGEAAVLPPPMLWLVLLSTLLPSGCARGSGAQLAGAADVATAA